MSKRQEPMVHMDVEHWFATGEIQEARFFRTFSAFDRDRPLYRRKFGRSEYLWDGFQWCHCTSNRPAPARRNEEFCRRALEDLERAGFCSEENVQLGRQAFAHHEEVQGQVDSIETLARHVLRSEPDHPAALRVLCAALRMSAQPWRALHATAGRGRQDAHLLAARSGALFDLGRFGGARLEIEKALELEHDPQWLELREQIRQAA